MLTAKTERGGRGPVPSALLMLLLIFVNGTITPVKGASICLRPLVTDKKSLSLSFWRQLLLRMGL